MEHAREELPTAGVTLRRWRADQAGELFRVATDALPHLAPWMAWAAGDYTVDRARVGVADVQRTRAEVSRTTTPFVCVTVR